MVIYEVNLDINTEIFEPYYAWLVSHVKHILQLPGFIGAEILKDNEANNKLTVCYRLASLSDYENYIAQHATAFREEGLRRFPNQFKATRRVFQVKDTFNTCLQK